MKTGELIRKYRKDKKITMKVLGEKIGVSEQAISQYERGTRNPNLETLIKISDALNVSINDLSQNKEMSPIQLLLKQEVLDKGISFKDLSIQTGVSEKDIISIYNCDGLETMEPFFNLFRHFGVSDGDILNAMVIHYKVNSIYNNDGSDVSKTILRDMFLSAPLTQEETDLGVQKMDNHDFAEYISILAKSNKAKVGVETPEGSIAIPDVVTPIDAYESLINLVCFVSKQDINVHIDSKFLESLLVKVCDLIEFESFKNKKEIQDSDQEKIAHSSNNKGMHHNKNK